MKTCTLKIMRCASMHLIVLLIAMAYATSSHAAVQKVKPAHSVVSIKGMQLAKGQAYVPPQRENQSDRPC